MKKLSIRHLIGIILIISNIWCFTGCTADKTSNSTNSKSQQETVTSIRIGKKASKFIEQPVQDVVDYLTELGFNNITTEASDKGETYAENDEVVSISIDGNDNFESKDRFNSTDKINIKVCDLTFYDGVFYDVAFTKSIVTKRDRGTYYYLFDEDTHTVYELEKYKGYDATAKKYSYEGEIGGVITINIGSTPSYYSTAYNMVKCDENGELVQLSNDQYDPKYTRCDVENAVKMLILYSEQNNG